MVVVDIVVSGVVGAILVSDVIFANDNREVVCGVNVVLVVFSTVVVVGVARFAITIVGIVCII